MIPDPLWKVFSAGWLDINKAPADVHRNQNGPLLQQPLQAAG